MKKWFDKNYKIQFPSAVGEKKHIGYPCFADTKYDGELNFVIIRDGVVQEMVNKDKYGGHRTDFPALDQIAQLNIKGDVIVVCELYMGSGDGAVYEFLRNRKNPDLKCALFAMLNFTETSPNHFIVKQKPFEVMREELCNLFNFAGKNFSNIHISKGEFVNSEQDLRKAVNKAIGDGWEGIIAKANQSRWNGGDTTVWTKIKKKATADLPVIGFSRKAKHLSVLLGHEVNGKLEALCHCGGGFKMSEKLEMRARLETARLPAELQFDTKNILVEPSIMVEVDFQEVLHTNGKLTGLRHPSFVRERKDKDITDISFDQKVAF